MRSYTVTIGRNLGTGEPMSDELWAMFEDEVNEKLTEAAEWLISAGWDNTCLEVHHGRGCWEGVEEDSAKLTLISAGEIDYVSLGELKRSLAFLAHAYGQEAIAFTEGEPQIIEALDLAEAHRRVRERLEAARRLQA